MATQFDKGDIVMFVIMLCAFTAAPPPVDPYREFAALHRWLMKNGMRIEDGRHIEVPKTWIHHHRRFAERYADHDIAIQSLFEVRQYAARQSVQDRESLNWATQELKRHAKRPLNYLTLALMAKDNSEQGLEFLAEVMHDHPSTLIRYRAAAGVISQIDLILKVKESQIDAVLKQDRRADELKRMMRPILLAREVKLKAQALLKELREKGELPNLAVGRPAPRLAAVDWDGKPVSLADLRGKVVVLEFWFANCGPCRARIPASNALAKEMKGKPFTTVWVVTDKELDAPKRIRAKTPIEGQHWWVKPEAGKRDLGPLEHWNVLIDGYPSVWVIDHKGVLRHHQTGYDPATDKVPDVVRDLVKKVEAPR